MVHFSLSSFSPSTEVLPTFFPHSFQTVSQYTICLLHLRKLTDKEETRVI